jgi:hypothetical protein
VAPEGYEIIDEAPALDTEEQQTALIGKTILHAWDNATGKWQSSGNLIFVLLNILSTISYPALHILAMCTGPICPCSNAMRSCTHSSSSSAAAAAAARAH